MRLEKRMQTLLSLGGEDVADAIVQQDTIGAGEAAPVTISRDVETGISSWSVEESSLNSALAAVENGESEQNTTMLTKDPEGVKNPKPEDTNITSEETKTDLLIDEEATTKGSPTQPVVLPAVSPEEQYRFALGRALQNDLETAELAFNEFRTFNKGHAREADSIFWLGRVQFMRGEFEKAAMTFSEFNSAYPGDARLVDTTMWIAESVSHFAPPEQACEIYASLPQLIDVPPDTFLEQISKLSDDANCTN